MRFCYADPPYIGQAHQYSAQNPAAAEVNHAALIGSLYAEFPDGWALSASSPSLRQLIPLLRDGTRIMAWVKTMARFRPDVSVHYSWEPVIVHGGRRYPRNWHDRPFDWIKATPPVNQQVARNGFPGEKPRDFCFWLFRVLNLRDGDDFVDLYPGSGAVTRAWDAYRRQGSFLDASQSEPAEGRPSPEIPALPDSKG